MNAADTFAPLIGDVAIKLLGEPDQSSGNGATMRWGSRGSFKVDTADGVWHDKEANEGGGVLALVMREKRCNKTGALEWLEGEGLIEPRSDDIPRYLYHDAKGSVAYAKARVNRPDQKYQYQHFDGQCWRAGRNGADAIPYRLPGLIAAPEGAAIYMAEGEKHADKLASWGLVATSLKDWNRDFGKYVKGRTVIILPDNDDPGEEQAAKAARLVREAGGDPVQVLLPGLPIAGDIMDWQGSADDLAAHVREALAAPQPEEPAPALLPMIDLAAWQGEPPPRESAWGDWLPLRYTTMLTGPGGIGKSLLDQMLLTYIALGRSFLGMETRQANCLYVTCEDDTDELWRRQAGICAALNLPISAVIGKLHLVSLCGQTDTALATFDADGRIMPTERWHQLVATTDAFDIGVYAFDNATDAMAGDLNDIHQVAEFVNLLTSLAIRRNGVAMILHHPNKAGDDWLGSVAWHNKVRSRLIIEAGDEDDPDTRVIINPKANYGPQGGKIAFRWHCGAFVRDKDLPSDERAEIAVIAKANGENSAFLGCLAAATDRQRAVSHNPGSNYAPKVFSGMPEAKGFTAKSLAGAMERLLHLNTIALDQPLWRGPNRVMKQGIRLAEKCTDPPARPPCTNPLHKPARNARKCCTLQPPYR